MFTLKYVVVKNEYDEFFGQSGFYEFCYNGKTFGEIYPEEIIDKIIPEHLYDWLDRIVRVAIHLLTKPYVLLSDVENFDDWLEFRCEGDKLFVSMIKSEKRNGSADIEFQLKEGKKAGYWADEEISLHQFVEEIKVKVGKYVDYILAEEPNNEKIQQLNKRLKKLNISD